MGSNLGFLSLQQLPQSYSRAFTLHYVESKDGEQAESFGSFDFQWLNYGLVAAENTWGMVRNSGVPQGKIAYCKADVNISCM